MSNEKVYATGRRKESVARVWVENGNGTITINGRPSRSYLMREVLQMVIDQPFKLLEQTSQYNIKATVNGGGLTGQAGALLHGISRAFASMSDENRAILKKAGFLTRDARMVERKKYGRAKARKRFQFSKR